MGRHSAAGHSPHLSYSSGNGSPSTLKFLLYVSIPNETLTPEHVGPGTASVSSSITSIYKEG